MPGRNTFGCSIPTATCNIVAIHTRHAAAQGGLPLPRPETIMLLWLLRGLFIAIVIGMAGAAFNTFSDFQNARIWPGIRAALLILAIAGVVLFTDLWERNKQISTLSAIYFGLILGLFLGWLFSLGLEQF